MYTLFEDNEEHLVNHNFFNINSFKCTLADKVKRISINHKYGPILQGICCQIQCNRI